MCDAALSWLEIHIDLPPHLPSSLIEQHPNKCADAMTNRLLRSVDSLMPGPLDRTHNSSYEKTVFYPSTAWECPQDKHLEVHISAHPHIKFHPGAAEKQGCVRTKHMLFSSTPRHRCKLLMRKRTNGGNCSTLWHIYYSMQWIQRVKEDIRHRSAWLGAQYFSIRMEKYQKKLRKKSCMQEEAESKYVPTKWLPGFSHFTVAVKFVIEERTSWIC